MSNSSRSHRVLVSDSVDTAGLQILKSFAEVDVKTKLTEAEICQIIRDYDALVVRSGTQVTERIIQAGRKLKIIGRAGVGVDNVDVHAATSKGIFVVNSPQGNTIAAAEHTLALMFAVVRHIPAADASVRAGKWEREKFMGDQLQHRTLGIVGLGQVGAHVARVCREMGMDLLVFDPYINVAKAESLGCRIVSLDELLSEADVVTLHVPLTTETRYLLDATRLSLMKQSAFLINCSRGGVVDEQALCDALAGGHLAGAALDVFEKEGKMAEDSPLLKVPNLVLTPHLGASTHEAQVNVAIDVAQQIKQTLQGNLPESAVNIPGLRVAELASLMPLIEACEVFGRLAIQILSGPLEQLNVVVEGSYATLDKTEALLLASANGAMSVYCATRVNFVNVRQIAEQHRVKMMIAKDPLATKNGISVELRSGTSLAGVRGTVTEDGAVLLKAFDNIPVYMILPTPSKRPATASSAGQIEEGRSAKLTDEYQCSGTRKVSNYFLYSRHDDTPGVLARITAALATVNIANCHLGRERGISIGSRGSALAIFHLDEEIPSAVLETVNNIDAVRVCKMITL